MKKLDVVQLQNLNGESNRQCFIDGALTCAGVIVGAFAGGYGAAIAAIAGGYAMNANGCFG